MNTSTSGTRLGQSNRSGFPVQNNQSGRGLQDPAKESVKTVFRSSFAKDLKSIKSGTLHENVAKLIELVEAAPSLAAIPDVKKLKAKGNYYRIKLGDYRVGITVKKDEITFVRCLDQYPPILNAFELEQDIALHLSEKSWKRYGGNGLRRLALLIY